MDIVFIVRDASASSVIGNLLLAVEAHRAGRKTAVLFTQEALAALARGSFAWPRELSGQQMRLMLSDHGSKLGVPVAGRGEGRQLDPRAMITRVAEAGVALYACAFWTDLLGLKDGLPTGLIALDSLQTLQLVADAKTVIGSL